MAGDLFLVPRRQKRQEESKDATRKANLLAAIKAVGGYMKLFHKHDWKIAVKTYTEPRSMNELSLINCSEYMAERLLMGTTTIIYECSGCPKLRREEMLGKVKT